MGFLLTLFGIIFLYVFAKLMLKEPIIPWKENTISSPKKFSKSKKTADETSVDEDVRLFDDFIREVQSISSHMLRRKDDSFTMYIHVQPVNYDLLSDTEQEYIDAAFESWLSTIDMNIRWYLQNRFIDLSEPIIEMRKNISEADDLPMNAVEFGENMIQNLEYWQRSTPRYDTKRYILFTTKVNPNKISADSEQEYEEKLVERAFSELYRSFQSSKNSLRKAKIELELVPSEGIVEILYHAFNRRRASKTKFKDIISHEQLASYVTADQDESHIELVKEMIEEDEAIKNREPKKEEGEKREESLRQEETG